MSNDYDVKPDDLTSTLPHDLSGRWTDDALWRGRPRKVKMTSDGVNVKATYINAEGQDPVGCELRDALNTIVPYDEDFHGQISPDGARLQGDISYCHWDTKHPGESGTKHAFFKAKISPDRSRIEGCFKTPYQRGETRFTATADYTVIEIRYRVFIPSPAVALIIAGRSPEWSAQAYRADWLLAGDGRSFSYDTGTNRVFQSVMVSADPLRNHPIIGKKRAWFGESRQFEPRQGRPDMDKPDWWWNLKPGEFEKPLHRERLVRDDANNRIDVDRLPGAGGYDNVEVALTINAGVPATQPLRAIAFHIHSNLVVYLRQKAGEMARYAIFGQHAAFPAHELYINRQLVHQYDPLSGGTSPFALSDLAPIRVDTGYQKDPATWPTISPMPVDRDVQAEWNRTDVCAEVPDVPLAPSKGSQGSLTP